MSRHLFASSYLIYPYSTSRQKAVWAGIKTSYVQIKRHNSRYFTKVGLVLSIWIMLVWLIQFPSSSAAIPGQNAFIAKNSVSNPMTTSSPTPIVSLTSSEQLKTLTGGPSGQLLPAGTMASDRTYQNNYARGQCTWYVAGRRQVPANWGNANQWYYHAVSSGWKVGTTPAIAAIAWTNAGWYGHVALVEQISTDGKSVYISEMNYRGVGVKSYRWVNASSFKYIY